MRYHGIDLYKGVEDISLHEFNKFRMGIYNPSDNQTYTLSTNQSNRPNKSKSNAEAFKKSIKRDRSSYPTIREDKQCDK